MGMTKDGTYGGLEVSKPPNLEETLLFRRAKTVLQRTSTGEFTESRAIDKLLLLKKKVADEKCSQGNL